MTPKPAALAKINDDAEEATAAAAVAAAKAEDDAASATKDDENEEMKESNGESLITDTAASKEKASKIAPTATGRKVLRRA